MKTYVSLQQIWKFLRNYLQSCRNYLQESAEGSFQEVARGKYYSFVVCDLAEAEGDHSTMGVDSTSLQLEWKLLGNYLQQGPEGSFPEVTKYQNLHPVHERTNKSGSFSETTFSRALKVVSREWLSIKTYCPRL